MATNLDEIRAKAEQAKTAVLSQLKWDNNRYCTYQYNLGCAFLEYRYGIVGDLSESMGKNRLFWNWWRLQWAKRDGQFADVSTMLFDHEKESYYTEVTHTMEAITVYPPKVVLEALHNPEMV